MRTDGPVHTVRSSPVELAAKLLGLLLFLVGIGMLLISFRLAYEMFDQLASASHAWVRSPVSPSKEPSWTELGIQFGGVILKIGLLFVMGYLASLVSWKGTQLYGAAARATPQVTPVLPELPSAASEPDGTEVAP